MKRFNGVGTTLLGFRRTGGVRDPNLGFATKWFTIFFLPIVPLGRRRIRITKPHGGRGLSFQDLGSSDPSWAEIALTYATGWIMWPVILFGPIVVLSGGDSGDPPVFLMLWWGGAGVAAVMLRDRRFRYVTDVAREQRESSARTVVRLLRKAGLPGGGSVTECGYLLAAAMIVADGEAGESEFVLASAIGDRLFPDFSTDALRRVVRLGQDLPPVGQVGSLLRESVPPDGKELILRYLQAIAEADGVTSPEETELLKDLERSFA